MPSIIKNNLGVIVTIAMWFITGATSVGAAWTILNNIKDNQIIMQRNMDKQFGEIKASFEKYKDKSDEKFTLHDQRITRCETKLEAK